MINKESRELFSVKDKIVVITGAASGIGLEVAKLFSKQGAQVYMLDRNPESINHAVNEIENSHFLQLDITSNNEINNVINQIVKEVGRIDILVNSAGIGGGEWAEKISEEKFRNVINVNLNGTFFMSQRVGQEMIKGNYKGKIISIASQAGLVAIDRHVAYGASKAGVIAMTKVLAYEWGKYGIQVNTVSPTVTNTPLIDNSWNKEDVKKEAIKNIPAGRYCNPEEIAHAVLYLSSQEANMITGENLVIDGGYTIH